MPGMPDLPVQVDPTVRQEDGPTDRTPVYQTHRGKKAPNRDVGDLPPEHEVPTEFARYEES